MANNAIVQVQDVHKEFDLGSQKVTVLKKVSVEIMQGEFAVIIGPSGCGKSTLLHIILGLEVPTEGKVFFLGENIYDDTNEDYRSNFRKKHIGMMYQQANWIKSLNVGENVAFPLVLLGMEKVDASQKALEILTRLGMEKWVKNKPTELSGGQQQRVAMARALINNPEIIIADEPTGNLDYKSGVEVMQLIQGLNKEHKKTVIMVTHDLEYIQYADKAIRMLDGEVTGVYTGKDKEKLRNEIQGKRGNIDL